ncbi:MAG: E3 binding domain-containing protein, partial [Candidatus Eremiobacteraeota bacterium]|nr:E3 binding domain-containing protein [Candidatus Eremiobacteraeota bacterium]
MSETIDVRVPDIGDFTDVPVIEVLVKPGDTVKKNDSLITLESEKASMEVPSDVEGVVDSVVVKIGDKVSKGTIVATLTAATTASAPPASPAQTINLAVPDIGDFKDVPVIEVLVKPGDAVAKDAPLVVLESEKASMEVPASAAGTIAEVKVKPGDKVSQGTVIATATTQAAVAPQPVAPQPVAAPIASAAVEPPPAAPSNGAMVHASPAIRRFARELGVDIHGLKGSGPHGRITREDVQGYVKTALREGTGKSVAGGATFAGLPAWPKVDFAQFGEIERKALTRIQKISGPNLHRNWVMIPHVTQNDEADVTDLEAFRKTL